MATTLNICRIDCASDDAREAIAGLRRQLSPDGNVVSPQGAPGRSRRSASRSPRSRSSRGSAPTCNAAAWRPCSTTPPGSTASRLEPCEVRVSREELAAAFRAADPAYLRTIRRVRDNILAFQSGILHRDAVMRRGRNCELRLRYRPLRRVGVCIPGGAAAYPSSLMMTVVPALAAGVEEIAVVVPPTPFGGYNTDLLAACHALGVTEVHRVGGAQAVAALAYGVDGIERSTRSSGRGTCSSRWPSGTSTARSTSTASPGRARSS